MGTISAAKRHALAHAINAHVGDEPTFDDQTMIVIKRKTERKFYEYLLHHFVAATLILFSMMCNEIAAGTMILIVHDLSDIPIAFCRAYI